MKLLLFYCSILFDVCAKNIFGGENRIMEKFMLK